VQTSEYLVYIIIYRTIYALYITTLTPTCHTFSSRRRQFIANRSTTVTLLMYLIVKRVTWEFVIQTATRQVH